jgi:muramoyltetrapeptide carboxypeptidase
MSKLRKTSKSKPKTRASSLETLKPGDLIEIIAPGSHAPLEHLEKGAAILRSWGYRVSYDSQLLDPQIFLANSDEKRFESFKKAINNSESKAVWCLRGGYGAIRLLPMIEKMSVPKNKKLLIGLSDISSLHAIINQKWKWPSLHAPLIDRLALNKLSVKNINELRSVLEDQNYVTSFKRLIPLNAAATSEKKIKSEVVGGNLMVVTSTLGTPSQIIPKNKILFLEEIAERAYRVDRCLQQMKQAGVLDGVRAVVFGEFINCNEPNGENYIWASIEAFCKTLKTPFFKGVECGHGEQQRPLFFMTSAHLTCGKKPQMLVYSAFKE